MSDIEEIEAFEQTITELLEFEKQVKEIQSLEEAYKLTKKADKNLALSLESLGFLDTDLTPLETFSERLSKTNVGIVEESFENARGYIIAGLVTMVAAIIAKILSMIFGGRGGGSSGGGTGGGAGSAFSSKKESKKKEKKFKDKLKDSDKKLERKRRELELARKGASNDEELELITTFEKLANSDKDTKNEYDRLKGLDVYSKKFIAVMIDNYNDGNGQRIEPLKNYLREVNKFIDFSNLQNLAKFTRLYSNILKSLSKKPSDYARTFKNNQDEIDLYIKSSKEGELKKLITDKSNIIDLFDVHNYLNSAVDSTMGDKAHKRLLLSYMQAKTKIPYDDDKLIYHRFFTYVDMLTTETNSAGNDSTDIKDLCTNIDTDLKLSSTYLLKVEKNNNLMGNINANSDYSSRFSELQKIALNLTKLYGKLTHNFVALDRFLYAL